MAGTTTEKLVAVYDVFDILSAPNPPLYVMPAFEAYRTWQRDVPFPKFTAAHLTAGPPPPPALHPPNSYLRQDGQKLPGGSDSTKSGLYSNWRHNYRYQHSSNREYSQNYRSPQSWSSASNGRLSVTSAFKSGDGQHNTLYGYCKSQLIKPVAVDQSPKVDASFFHRKKKPDRLDNEYVASENSEKSAKRASGDHGSCIKENLGSNIDPKGKMQDHDAVIIGRYPADPSGGGSLVITKTKSRVICRLEYSREFMLQCSLSPWTKLSPVQMPLIVHNFPDLLPRYWVVWLYLSSCVDGVAVLEIWKKTVCGLAWTLAVVLYSIYIELIDMQPSKFSQMSRY